MFRASQAAPAWISVSLMLPADRDSRGPGVQTRCAFYRRLYIKRYLASASLVRPVPGRFRVPGDAPMVPEPADFAHTPRPRQDAAPDERTAQFGAERVEYQSLS